jgi:hypothetical protein
MPYPELEEILTAAERGAAYPKAPAPHAQWLPILIAMIMRVAVTIDVHMVIAPVPRKGRAFAIGITLNVFLA